VILNTFSTSESPQKVVIAIHGWTGDVSSMEPVARSLRLPDTKWVFPQAPYKSDKSGYTWFYGNNETGWKYKDSFKIISSLIQDLIDQGFKYNEIFLLGFSQGACLTMEWIIRQPFSIGGIIPIAGFIKYKDRFKIDANLENKETPVLLIHGDRDKVIFPEESEKALKLFDELGYSVNFNLVSAGHKIPLKAKNLITDFIMAI
jgi:phospholipase/carboxylesterase